MAKKKAEEKAPEQPAEEKVTEAGADKAFAEELADAARGTVTRSLKAGESLRWTEEADTLTLTVREVSALDGGGYVARCRLERKGPGGASGEDGNYDDGWVAKYVPETAVKL